MQPDIQGVCQQEVKSLKMGYGKNEKQGFELIETASHMLRTNAMIWCI